MEEISKQLLKRHIMPNKKGYTYFKEALYLMAEKDGEIANFVEEIYTPIANSHNVCVAAVIKAMTACLDNAVLEKEDSLYTAIDGRNSLKGFLIELYYHIF